jgi:hypothetical protein
MEASPIGNEESKMPTPGEHRQPECRRLQMCFGMLDGDGSWSELHRSLGADIYVHAWREA